MHACRRTPLFASMIKQSWACYTTRDQESDDEPLESLCIMYHYVCLSRKALERGLHPSQYAKSEWVVSRGLSDKTGLRNNKPKERSSPPAVAFRRPLREARGRMPAQNRPRTLSMFLGFRALRLFDRLIGAPLDVIGALEDVAFVYGSTCL